MVRESKDEKQPASQREWQVQRPWGENKGGSLGTTNKRVVRGSEWNGGSEGGSSGRRWVRE